MGILVVWSWTCSGCSCRCQLCCRHGFAMNGHCLCSARRLRTHSLVLTRLQALPVTAVRGKDIPISFAITNDEGKPVSYQYVVASGSGAKLESLSSATETVAAGATWNVDSHCSAQVRRRLRCRVQVSLPQQGERIDFMFTYQDQEQLKEEMTRQHQCDADQFSRKNHDEDMNNNNRGYASMLLRQSDIELPTAQEAAVKCISRSLRR